jgi:hypothetical protein
MTGFLLICLYVAYIIILSIDFSEFLALQNHLHYPQMTFMSSNMQSGPSTLQRTRTTEQKRIENG